jgi:2-polyprenyl-3-methyl-5-hydroxy-6-metoxy-1,4-benzoquinol methylase
MAEPRLLRAMKRLFVRKYGVVWSSFPDEGFPTSVWQEAQKYEREFWVEYIRKELGLTRRDEMVGFRLCEGRIHLCHFGLDWNDWMYSKTPPVIAGRLLDVGSSAVSVFEKCRSVSVIAIDPSLEQLARGLPEIVILGKINNCEYRCCRIQDVPETNFDVVWCNNVLDHTDDWRNIIYHFSRVLRQSGRLFLGTDVRGSADLLDVGHISAFTASEVLAEVVANGFEVVWQSPHLDLSQYRFSLRARKREQ